MKKIKVKLIHNQDGTFSVYLEKNHKQHLLKVFYRYIGDIQLASDDVCKSAYYYAYNLSCFLNCNLTELK